MARRILASPTAAWERAFASFVAYPADADGKRRVPSKHVTSDGFALGSWIARQLNAHKKGKLDHERLSRLRGAGAPFGLGWDEAFALFEAFPPNPQVCFFVFLFSKDSAASPAVADPDLSERPSPSF